MVIARQRARTQSSPKINPNSDNRNRGIRAHVLCPQSQHAGVGVDVLDYWHFVIFFAPSAFATVPLGI
jgi:hypothetical protein